MGPGRHTGLGEKRGAILRAHQKKDFGAIPYFLVIANYEIKNSVCSVDIVSPDTDEQAQQINFKSVLPKQNTF